MIAVRLRTVRAVTETPVGVDDHGAPIVEQTETLSPKGVAPGRALATEVPVADAEQVYYVADDDVPDGARRLRPTDVPERWDLPEGHPLRGCRVLRCVPAGMGDCTVDAEGRLTTVDPGTGAPVAEPAGEFGAAAEVPR